MNLVEVLRVVRERRLIIVSCLLLGLLGAAIATYFIPQTYSAQVTMFVAGSPPAVPAPATAPASVDPDTGTTAAPPTPVTTPQLDSVYQANQLAQARMSSYVQLLTSDRMTAPVVQALNLGMEPSDLADEMTVSNVPNTVVLTLAVTDHQPDRAAQIANALAEQFVGLVQQLEAQSGSNQISVVVLQPASVPTQAISPRPLLNLALGAGLGLLLGVVGAFVRNTFDTSIRSRESLAKATGAPTLGIVPFIRGLARQPLIVDRGTQASLAEAFRQLRTNLYFSPGATQGSHHANTVNATLVNVVVTSSLSGEGTTSTLGNLAIAEAEAGRKVMVIDANLRSPGIIELFGLETGPGLAEVLTGGTTLPSAIQTWRRAGTTIDILPSGASPARPSDLLSSRAMITLLASVRSRYDLVLIDTPPLLPVTDAAAVAPHADGVLLVVRYGKTQAEQIETATDALDAVSGVLVGTVISMVPSTSPRIRLERSKNPRAAANSATEPRAESEDSGDANPAGTPEPAESQEPEEGLEPARSSAANRMRPKPKTPAPTAAGRRRMLS